MRRQIIVTCGLLLTGCMLCSCGILPTEEEFDAAPVVKEYEGSNYNKYTVVRGDMVQKESVPVTYQGTVKADTTGDGAGTRIKKVCVKKGQKVEIGDTLVENYLAEQENIIKKTNREVESLQLQIKQAKEMKEKELARLKKVGGSSAQKKNVRAQYDSQIKNCESSLELAKLDIKSAKQEISANEITSDIDGTVTFVDESFNGGYATSEDVLVTVQGKKKNRFRCKSKYASMLKEGQEMLLTVTGQQYKAKVKKTSEKNVVYFYPNTSSLTIKNGVSGSFDLILKEKKNVLFVPTALVFEMGDKKIVYMEGENGVKTTKEVTLGEQIDNLVEITSGLQENDQIITN